LCPTSTTASPGRTPDAAIAFTSAATSARISAAILLPSRILAVIQPRAEFVNPKRFYRNCRRCLFASSAVKSVIMIPQDLLDILVCPACKKPLVLKENPPSLKCGECRRVYPIQDGIPILLIDAASIDAA
jgi:uncharacterized protein YbaR (Trm112 family)